MAIPYRTTKFKSANIFYNDNLGPNRQIQFPPIFPVIRMLTLYLADTTVNDVISNTCHPTEAMSIEQEIYILGMAL